MTVVPRPPLAGHAGAVVLGDADVPAALAVCAVDPVASVLASSRLEQAAVSGVRRAGGELWGYHEDGTLLAVCWVGANLVPVLGTVDPDVTARALAEFARLGRERGRRCSSIVGAADPVLGLWSRLRGSWPSEREIRAHQPSMVIDSEPLVPADPRVRRSRPEEYGIVLPACIAMFTEEVGYSPASGPEGPYEQRVRRLVAEGSSFVLVDRVGARRRPGVVFKAEVPAVACGVAQVQGVWVDPSRRGERLSEAGMAAVVQAVRADVAPVVSLYVNGYNTRAVRAYEAVGFREVGAYATVLF